jgi:hypothetical protein
MKNQEIAAMLRHDAAQLGRVVEGVTAELPLSRVAPEMIRHLTIAADALDEAGRTDRASGLSARRRDRVSGRSACHGRVGTEGRR